MHPGGRWCHEYQATELHEFAGVDPKYDTKPKDMKKHRFRNMQEVRLPADGISFTLEKHYELSNSTLEGIQAGLPLLLSAHSDNVEPLLVRGPQPALDTDEVVDEVGTSYLVADHRAEINGPEQTRSGEFTPPTELAAAPPELRDLPESCELRSDPGLFEPGVKIRRQTGYRRALRHMAAILTQSTN
mgnify:CR=1 FL=1